MMRTKGIIHIQPYKESMEEIIALAKSLPKANKRQNLLEVCDMIKSEIQILKNKIKEDENYLA